MGIGKANDSLFFALRPDAEAAARIGSRREELRAALGLKGKPISADRLHVTLHHLGSFGAIPEELVAQAREAAAAIRAAPFEIALDVARSFPRKTGNRPFVLGCSQPSVALLGFHKLLGASLAKAGLPVERRRLTPHVTLMYDALQVNEQAVVPIRWTVNEFVLLYSFYGQSRHELLGRWELVKA